MEQGKDQLQNQPGKGLPNEGQNHPGKGPVGETATEPATETRVQGQLQGGNMAGFIPL